MRQRIEKSESVTQQVEVDETCETCTFFNRGKYDSQCERYPQEVRKNKADWCGEWKSA